MVCGLATLIQPRIRWYAESCVLIALSHYQAHRSLGNPAIRRKVARIKGNLAKKCLDECLIINGRLKDAGIGSNLNDASDNTTNQIINLESSPSPAMEAHGQSFSSRPTSYYCEQRQAVNLVSK